MLALSFYGRANGRPSYIPTFSLLVGRAQERSNEAPKCTDALLIQTSLRQDRVQVLASSEFYGPSSEA